MNHRVGRSLHRLEGLSDNVLPGLGQHLNGHVIRNHIPLDECADKVVLRIGRSREAHLDFLEADFHQ